MKISHQMVQELALENYQLFSFVIVIVIGGGVGDDSTYFLYP